MHVSRYLKRMYSTDSILMYSKQHMKMVVTYFHIKWVHVYIIYVTTEHRHRLRKSKMKHVISMIYLKIFWAKNLLYMNFSNLQVIQVTNVFALVIGIEVVVVAVRGSK